MTGYRLLELKIELNRKCPLQCLHCSSNGMSNACEKLPVDRVCHLVEEFRELGGKKVSLSGGEPLCYEGLIAVVNACTAAGVKTTLYTTGIGSVQKPPRSVSDKMLEFFATKHVRLVFSVHGAKAQTHDALTRVKGSFQATMSAMSRALDAGVVIEAHVVPTALNFDELADIAALLTSMEVKKVSWLRFVPQGRGLLNRAMLTLSNEQLKQLAVMKIESGLNKSIEIRTGAPFNILTHQIAVPCDAGINVLTIRPDGEAVPCDAFKRFSIQDEFGNILHHTLAEVWQKSYFLNEIRGNQESKSTSACASCASYSLCNSGCLAQKAIVAGRLTDSLDPQCLRTGVEVPCDEVEAVSVH